MKTAKTTTPNCRIKRGDQVVFIAGKEYNRYDSKGKRQPYRGKVIAVEYNDQPLIGHTNAPVEMLNSGAQDVAAIVREMTDGHGADIVFNTVGSPYFEIANKAMAKQARQIFISTFDRAVPFDIFTFFRGRHKYIGVDTLALSSVDGARIFDRLKLKFEEGLLKPFPINPDCCYGLGDAAKAYASVLRGTPERVLLKP